VLGDDAEAESSKDEVLSSLFESRRQPRDTNASLSSLSVSRRPASSSSSLSQAPAPANGGMQFIVI